MKKLNQLADQLNRVIHARNLYRNGVRMYNARVVMGVVVVANLWTDKDVEYVNDGSFTDGYNQPVII